MPTFLINPDQIHKGIVTIRGREAHHFSRVLRIGVGESVTLADGQGRLFRGTVLDTQRVVTLKIHEELPPLPDPYPVHLFISLIKGGNTLEGIVEQAVELNIDSVHFLRTERSVLPDLAGPKWERLGRIASAAQKQCGRSHPLRLITPRSFQEAVVEAGPLISTHLIFEERSQQPSLREIFRTPLPPPYGLWIGPEGGWDKTEIAFAAAHGFRRASLGPFVLRAPTAALHALSSLLALVF